MRGRARALCVEIHDRLREVGDAERRRVAVGYFPTNQKVIGVATPKLRAIVRDVARRMRAAVVSTVALNQKSRGGSGDAPCTIAVCERVVDDHDDMVAKGLSWALRALIAPDRRAVEAFLDQHGDRLAARVRQEVRNKLATGLKAGRRGKGR